MSQDHEEDATDALLRDLESRSSSTSGSVDDDDEDLEAFLASLEDDSSSSSRPVATKTKDSGPAPAIKEAPKAELQVPEKKASKKEKPEKAEEKEKKSRPEGSRSAKEKLAAFGTFLKVLLVSISTLGLWWILGAYLAQWISAWWLILGLATIVVGSLPPALRLAARKRGKISWWFAGVSTSLLVLLIAPIPNQAASAIGSYGHWPATSIAQGASLTPDWMGVRIFNWASATLASNLSSEVTSPLVLGGTTPLTQAPTPAESQPGPKPEPSEEAIEAVETETPPPTVE